MARPDRSVVVPVFNEAESVPRLHEALARMADAAPGGWEFSLKRNFWQTEELGCRVLGVRKGSW